ncbi:MAG TPA: MBOAT family O-acyltransferase [Terriglobales bacterium]|nr:MBOAT family O-acyltransferase [Terriglobales bacterium]
MLFREILYGLVFLLCVVVFAKVRSRAVRQPVLLIGCYALYLTWGAWFAVVLLTSTVMNFLLGKWLQRKPSGPVLSTGILLNLALLGGFKYLPEIAVNVPLSSFQRFSHLALPLGISFWTFQAMSYLFDLYRGEDLDPSFFEFALYMVFFPVAISGPICRMSEMLPQFRSEQTTPAHDIGRGFTRIATGVLMMQLAQLLGQGILAGDGINSGFDHVTHWSGTDVWCLAFGYGLQLFLDFAGYSHIAIGAARALGFTVPENFARPFQSTSPSIFWTRWHMSLSFWIRDYVFLPLAVMRREMWWRNLALVISMVLFGLWHRASVLFVLWGCYHGVLLVLHRQVEALQRKFDWTPPAALWTPISWAATITLVSLGWIFFRAKSLLEARQMLAAVLSPASYSLRFLSGSLYVLVIAMAAGYMIVLLVTEALDRYSVEPEAANAPSSSKMIAVIARNRWFWIPPLYLLALLLVVIVTHTRGADAAQFMYRNF